MAGLESNFYGRANQYGATANSVWGGQLPKGSHMSPLPAVSANFRPETKVLFSNNSTPQVSPTRQPVGWAELLPSLGRTPRVQRKATTRKHNLRGTATGTDTTPPEPNASLVARLSLHSMRTIYTSDRKSNMKSVEMTPASYKARFSGDPSEDWLLHVDRLETERAKMHSWTPKEFYYALRSTLTGKALKTIRSMEDDMEITVFTDLIPKWFEPSGEDWRKLWDGNATFSTLSPRVQVAIVITYFHKHFQVRTPDEAYHAFRFSSQHPDESVEDWGKRVDRMVARLQRFGMNINFGQLLAKFLTTTSLLVSPPLPPPHRPLPRRPTSEINLLLPPHDPLPHSSSSSSSSSVVVVVESLHYEEQYVVCVAYR